MSDSRLTKLKAIAEYFKEWDIEIESSTATVQEKKRGRFTKETREDIDSMITGFTNLCKIVIERGSSLVPAIINSDVVENFFCQQRGVCNGLNSNPTYAQYMSSCNSIILTQGSVSRKSNASSHKSQPFACLPPSKRSRNQ